MVSPVRRVARPFTTGAWARGSLEPVKVFERCAVLFALLTVAPGCDEENDTSEPTEHSDVPAEIEGCVDGTDLVEIGETRACICDDGTEAEQTCLSTGEYADCKCQGTGW